MPEFCRSANCGKPIRWVRTTSGRAMPVDPLELNVWVPRDASWTVSTSDDDAVHVLVDTNDGWVARWALRSKPLLPAKPVAAHTSHFATCPDRDRFRRKR